MEECTETVEEMKIASENKHKNKGSSCILYIVLFSIIFTISIGIATYFVYYKYINVMKKMFMSIKAKSININRKSQANKY